MTNNSEEGAVTLSEESIAGCGCKTMFYPCRDHDEARSDASEPAPVGGCCPVCKDYSFSDRFCRIHGVRLEHYVCRNCGAEILLRDTFCSSCGDRVAR